MDIYSCLKTDHLNVKTLMEKVTASANATERRLFYGHIRDALTVHTVMEELTFYQALVESGGIKIQELIKHAESDHDDIVHLLRLLDITDCKSDKWLILFGQLQYCVEHHIEREETIIFDAAQKILSEAQAVALVESMEDFMQRMALQNAA